jgi:hypothetical protein
MNDRDASLLSVFRFLVEDSEGNIGVDEECLFF